MNNDSKKPKGRYDVSGNSEAQYVDTAETILVNKKGITDLRTLQIEEEADLAGAYELLLDEVRSDTPISNELICYVHKVIFGDLYEWAGKWRTVKISKEDTAWPPPDFLDTAMWEFEKNIINKYPANDLIDDMKFCSALGHIQGEFLAIHPFREGNARTIKLVTDILAVQTGRLPLIYDMTNVGCEKYIEAAKAAMLKEYDPMTTIIQKALAAT
ncbi:Fic family protein [Patescibacteria group bacterium]|nr:Fic family protein [Patescibacteria group bacterium]